MCFSSATLFHGTFVKAIPLFIAADAWTRIKPEFLALDIISSRRSKGTLPFEEGMEDRAGVPKLPVEVMEMVKQELVELELTASKEQFVDDGYVWLVDDVDNYCPTCYDRLYRNGGMDELADRTATATISLLADHRLCRPHEGLVSLIEDSWFDMNSLVPLALPLRSSSNSHFPSAVAQSNAEYGRSNGITKLDPSAMIPPRESLSRFRRFFSLFPLKTYDSSTATIKPFPKKRSAKLPAPAPSYAGQAGSDFDLPSVEDVFEDGEDEELQLDWHVWSLSPSCF